MGIPTAVSNGGRALAVYRAATAGYSRAVDRSCNGFCHATAFLLCVSLTLYYDFIRMVNIVTITPVPCSVPGDGMCQGSAIITSRSMQ